MKKTFIVSALFLLATSAMAVPAKRGQWRTITLSDGSQVRVELRGDEYMNFWQAEDGRRFVKNGSSSQFELADMTKLKERAKMLRQPKLPETAVQNAPAANGAARANSAYEGDKRGLVILIEFPNKQFTAGNVDYYNRILNEKNFTDPAGFVGSVNDYFNDQSEGKFNLTFDVAGPVMMPENYEYYGGDSPRQDAKAAEMWRYALNAVDPDIDFSKYDWNGDGQVEQVFFIYAGLGQANGGDENTIWPHKSAVVNAMGTDYLYFDNVRVYNYACSCELQPVSGHYEGNNYVVTETKIDGLGTICHEFSHCLGLADLYDVDYSGGYGMNAWDLMDQGSYNGNGFRPACYTGAERMWIGWKQPVELTEPTDVSAMKSIENGGESYIIRNDANSDEYYILDNRQQDGRWDAGLPGKGLLITHVDYKQSAWDNNGPNTDPDHQRCTPIPADNNFYTSTTRIGGDAYPYNDNNSLTNTTVPAAEVYTKNVDGSYFMNKPITNITQNADGTMSFSFSVLDTTPLFYESFDNCAGQGGNDGSFISMGTKPLGKGALNTDNTGWTGEGGGASKCALFAGEATTPEFTMNGTGTLTFNAAPLTGSVSNPTITISANGDATLGGNKANLSLGKFVSLTTDITGHGPVSITFTSEGSFFLDEVKVTGEVSTGIKNMVTFENKATGLFSNRIYSIDGRYVGTDASKLSKGLYICNGKKFVKE